MIFVEIFLFLVIGVILETIFNPSTVFGEILIVIAAIVVLCLPNIISKLSRKAEMAMKEERMNKYKDDPKNEALVSAVVNKITDVRDFYYKEMTENGSSFRLDVFSDRVVLSRFENEILNKYTVAEFENFGLEPQDKMNQEIFKQEIIKLLRKTSYSISVTDDGFICY